jgi:hypothetical protein
MPSGSTGIRLAFGEFERRVRGFRLGFDRRWYHRPHDGVNIPVEEQ